MTRVEGAHASNAERQLVRDMLYNSEYDTLVRPVKDPRDILSVKFGLSIVQLMDVDERNQIMTTSVWIKQEWHDYRLQWNPANYSGITTIPVPQDAIWRPDTVLYNYAEGTYCADFAAKAILSYTGKIYHVPPAIFKSPCSIDIEYFPFDVQRCLMKFGTWAYSGSQIRLEIMEGHAVKEDFWENEEWEIINAPGKNVSMKYPCCTDTYYHVVYTMVLRRRSLFYVVNLIVPCIVMAMLIMCVFCLPPDSGEKISLSISVLLALTVFQLLMAEIMPPTSSATPLVGKFLLFTTILVSSSIVVTVAVLNLHHRSASTHRMRPWVKKLFMQFLPKMLNMSYKRKPCNFKTIRRAYHLHEMAMDVDMQMKLMNLQAPESEVRCTSNGVRHSKPNSKPRMPGGGDYALLQEVRYITHYMRNEEKTLQAREDWQYVAVVLDRLFLTIFITCSIVGTCAIMLPGPLNAKIDVENEEWLP
uniref:Neuronal acetylcholine receptor subunit alpha-4-like n=1 Tax=Saccoglossus kowalevskii TaxID=10224 RepID=A0ABM0GZS0_SACKO|nr:PREDICTED: neuronal acetylcholine receptor subunit alpha-4-like [Saccoglossus kowalevskii]